MSDFWSYNTVREIIFVLLFISFFILVYRGAFKLFVDPKNFYWDRFMNLVWCFVSCIAIGDVLYQHNVPGGWRLWLVLAAALLQLFVVIWKSPYYQTEKPADDSV
jgi:tellurite resistance protein TehA-like permease